MRLRVVASFEPEELIGVTDVVGPSPFLQVADSAFPFHAADSPERLPQTMQCERLGKSEMVRSVALACFT